MGESATNLIWLLQPAQRFLKNLSESSIQICVSSIWGNFPLDSAWFKRWSAKISLEIPSDFLRKAARKPAESLVQSAASFRRSFYRAGWFFCHILFDNIYISNSCTVQLSIVFYVELYIQSEEQRQRVPAALCLSQLFFCRLNMTKILLNKARPS